MTSAPSSPTHPSRAHTTVSPFPLYTHHLSPVLLFTTRHVISLGLCAESERELLHCTLCVGCRLRNHHHHHLVVVVERRMTHAAAAIKPCSLARIFFRPSLPRMPRTGHTFSYTRMLARLQTGRDGSSRIRPSPSLCRPCSHADDRHSAPLSLSRPLGRR